MKKTQLLLIVAVLVFTLAGCKNEKEEPKSYKIGILQITSMLTGVEDGFKKGLADLGYVEGENVTYVYRNTNGSMDDLGRFAQEMMDEKVDLVFTITTPASLVMMGASQGKEIPIVFAMVSDPVGAGLVQSFTQPGGQVTGIRDAGIDTVGKRLELLQMVAPDIKKVLVLYSYEEVFLPAQENLREAAAALGLELVEKQVHTTEEARAVYQAIQPGEVDAIFVHSDAIVTDALEDIMALSARADLPYVFPGPVPGTMASYAENFEQVGVQAAAMAAKILKGTDPASIPVEIGKKFDLVIDLNAAEQAGLTIPQEVLNLADVVNR